jgi:hypothetical protein
VRVSARDILYGTNAIGKSETIQALGRQRERWVLEYDWSTSSMKRWYDKPTGICIKIYVVMNQQGITIKITETAILTNIAL